MKSKKSNPRRNRLFLMLALLLFVPLGLFAQGSGQVKGVVKDATGDPVIGATVAEVGNERNATVTDMDGRFTLTPSRSGTRLSVTYVGMKPQTIKAVDGTTITLQEDNNLLSGVEVVSVGYGNARRRDLTGSISSVGEKTLKHITTTNAASAITGRLAGVNVTTTQGSPDAEVKIRVRGGGSITQSNEPLYIVDGFQVSGISDIPPTDKDGIAIDLTGRKTSFGDGHANQPVLTKEEAAYASDMKNMFGSWNPTLLTAQAKAPTGVKLKGNRLTWDNRDDVLCWAVCQNGRVVAFTTKPEYTVIVPTDLYVVRAVNEMGGLGNATAVQ